MKPQKRYVALARVSSREQEREGFSLDVQIDALRQYAERTNGEIIRFFRIAETASKHNERKTFKELLAFAKKNAHKLDGLLFYKVDRAARNLFDYVELERLESDHGVQFISVSQPTENTPAGRMQRRMLASMASFYTEQQSIDVKEGIARRVESDLFPEREYLYYRCTQYHKGDHPRIRLTEKQLDSQMLALFETLRVEDAEFRDTFREQLRQATNWDERSSATRAKQLQDELVQVRDQQNRLLNLRMFEEIEADTFAAKNRELRERTAELQLEIEVCDRGRNETIDIAIKAFELSQSLREKWLTADYAAKRRILEITCLNFSLEGVSPVATMRKPFDLLAKGLVSKDSRGDRI